MTNKKRWLIIVVLGLGLTTASLNHAQKQDKRDSRTTQKQMDESFR